MVLRECKECGNEVSSKAAACPKCGAPVAAKGRPVLLGCLILIALFVVSLVVNAIMKGGNAIENTKPLTAQRDSAGRSAAKSTPVVKVHKMGESVPIGYTTYAVWDAWWSNRLSNNQFMNKPPNAMYLFVDVSVRNDDKQARTIPPFKLIDENGAEYDQDSSAWVIDGSLGILTDLNPSVSKQGFVVFDVPKERTYRLQVDGGYWSAESALIEIVPGEKPKSKKK